MHKIPEDVNSYVIGASNNAVPKYIDLTITAHGNAFTYRHDTSHQSHIHIDLTITAHGNASLYKVHCCRVSV